MTSSFEIVPGARLPRPVRHALFDFDGTLSLVRAGWADVMTKMFLEHLGEIARALALENILRLNGKPTIHQMEWLAATLAERGASAEAPTVYLEEFLRRLQSLIDQRLADDPARFLVPGAREMLEALRARGIALHLASGTDEVAVRREASALGIAHYFEDRIHGAPPDSRPFSKMAIIANILHDHGIDGAALVSFGDGHVETENTRRVGGLAVAVASDEDEPGSGRIDESKRARLLAVGAEVIIADFREAEALLDLLLAP